jgi:hypothetical protein
MKYTAAIPIIISLAVGFAAGYFTRTNDGFKIANGKIQYEDSKRPIQVIDDRIIVGSLEQRVADIILYEDPNTLRRVTRRIIQYEHQ